MAQAFPHQIWIDIGMLAGHSKNYNQHPKAQIDSLVADLKRFGQQKPIVIQNKAGVPTIVAGHGLVLAFKELAKHNLKEWGQIWAKVVPEDWTDEQVEGYMAADNETGRSAVPDKSGLLAILDGQRAAGYDLLAIGFSQQAYQDLSSSVHAADLVTPALPTTKGSLLSLVDITIDDPRHLVTTGDVFVLTDHDREHVLLCAQPFTDSKLWLPLYQTMVAKDSDALFLPFAGPFSLLGETAQESNVFIIQPDPYICGHTLDRFGDTHPTATIRLERHTVTQRLRGDGTEKEEDAWIAR